MEMPEWVCACGVLRPFVDGIPCPDCGWYAAALRMPSDPNPMPIFRLFKKRRK